MKSLYFGSVYIQRVSKDTKEQQELHIDASISLFFFKFFPLNLNTESLFWGG